MPKERAAPEPTSPAGDAFAALPDEILQHVLSFLPAQPAVRTCVLARRWRRLWEGVAGLRITAANTPDDCDEPIGFPEDVASSGQLREFVDHLLLLRGGAPLDSCEFVFHVRERDHGRDVPHINLWIRHVIRCQLRRLKLSITQEQYFGGQYFYVHNLPLVSRHLRRLELSYTRLNNSFLDLSGCPGLEYLYISNGDFVYAKRISSKSVKHLTVIDSCFNEQVRTIIDVPSVVSLRLEDPWGRTPVLASMPLLAMAIVRLGTDSIKSLDRCFNSESGDCDDEHCHGCYGLEGDHLNDSVTNGAKKNKSVLLNGLSEAKSLVLIDESHKFIFRRDVKWCPMFRMLKTLLLNEYWCVPPDFRELACLLEHSPVLEKLTIQFFSKGPEHKVEIVESYSDGGICCKPAILENLKIVEVKYEVADEGVSEVADEGVSKVLNFLQTLNIDFNFDEEDETLVEDVSTTS